MTPWEKLSQKHPEFLIWPRPKQETGMLRGFQPFPDAKVMDIGANIGVCSAFCALHGSAVTAYEADPVTYQVLSDMVAEMNFANKIKIFDAAIWTYTGKCSFHGFTSYECDYKSHNGALTSLLCPDNGKFREPESIDCIALADAIGNTIWDCIKLDVEGAEFEILLSVDSEILQKYVKFLYIEFHHGWANPQLYEKLIPKLERIFHFDGVKFDDGRWDHVSLRNKYLN